MPTANQTIDYVLRHCELFAHLSRQDIGDLSASCQLRQFDAGTVLAEEGQSGKEAYILVAGALEVFTLRDGKEVILARLDRPADHVGEHAMQTAAARARLASFRTTETSELVIVPKHAFRRALATNAAFDQHLRGKEQSDLSQLELIDHSAIYRLLVMYDEAKGGSQVEHFAAAQTVFRQGDHGDKIYIIRSGRARVTRQDHGQPRLLAVLHQGQPFGEQSVLEQRPRSATVTAETDLELLALSRDRFLEAMGHSPELHEYVATLREIYALGGGLTTQYDSTLMGEPAIVTVYRLPSDREVVVHHLVERKLYEAQEKLADDSAVKRVEYHDPQRKLRRVLGVLQGRLVHVHAEGPWNELEAIHSQLIQGQAIDADQLAQFARNGHLVELPDEARYRRPDAELCHCLALTRRQLEHHMARGSHSLESLVEVCAVTTVCGGCTARVAAMVGSVGVPVELLSIVPVLSEVKSFRFALAPQQTDIEPLHAGLPGQHVIVSAYIEQHWVHRPYTITSAADCTEWREITVRREGHGYLSNYLFDHPGQVPIRLSHPKGDFWVDLEQPHPIVCLVAGIGMTPALAIARSLAAAQSGQQLYIDYSARTERDFAYRQEFDQLCQNDSNIQIDYRVTGRGERITVDDLKDLFESYPTARFFICGPSAYELSVRNGLLEAGVATGQIHTEVFAPVGHAPEDAPVPPSTRRDAVISITSLALCVLYLSQALWPWQWPWLAQLQQQIAYRLLSGTLLFALLLWQWYLPLMRQRGLMAKVASLHLGHKYTGMLAPVLLYFHSTSLGFAYLAWLSISLLATIATGACDKGLCPALHRQNPFAQLWLSSHIIASVLLSALALVHIWVVFAYSGSAV